MEATKIFNGKSCIDLANPVKVARYLADNPQMLLVIVNQIYRAIGTHVNLGLPVELKLTGKYITANGLPTNAALKAMGVTSGLSRESVVCTHFPNVKYKGVRNTYIFPGAGGRRKMNGKVYGYARVSTKKQNIEPQYHKLRDMGCETIYEDRLSGVTDYRPSFVELMMVLEPGDILCVTSLCRISRSDIAPNLIMAFLIIKGVELVMSTAPGLSLHSPSTVVALQVLFASAAAEYKSMSERASRGMTRAREQDLENGVPLRFGPEGKLKAEAIEMYRMRQEGMSVIAIGDVFNLKRTAVHYYLRMVKNNFLDENGMLDPVKVAKGYEMDRKGAIMRAQAKETAKAKAKAKLKAFREQSFDKTPTELCSEIELERRKIRAANQRIKRARAMEEVGERAVRELDLRRQKRDVETAAIERERVCVGQRPGSTPEEIIRVIAEAKRINEENAKRPVKPVKPKDDGEVVE